VRSFPPRALLVVALALASMSGACATAGKHPGYVRCKGKALIGVLAGAQGFGGSYTINADCGEGFSFDQGRALESPPR
jgi:hypothetical protein